MRHAVVLAILVAAHTAHAATPLDRAIEAATALDAYDDRLDVNSAWTNVADAASTVAACRGALDELVAHGTTADQALPLPVGNEVLPHATAGHTTVKLLRAWCEARAGKVQLLRAYVAVKEADRASQQLSLAHEIPVRVRDVIALTAMKARVCTREVTRALAAHNAPALKLERPTTTLGEAQIKICAALATKLDAQRAKLPPGEIGAALPGDRATTFARDGLQYDAVFGASKQPLETADDLKYAAVWYVVLRDLDDAGAPAWILRAHRWDGDKLASTSETRGAGAAPPDDAFK